MKTPKCSLFLGTVAAIYMIAGLGMTHAVPAIGGCFPTGTIQFEWKYSTFSFVVTDSAPVTNIAVTLIGTRLLQRGTFVHNAVWPGTLTVTTVVTNTSTNYNCGGLQLEQNASYIATITACEAALTKTWTISFDTIKPIFLWEAEDYDFTLTNSDGTFQVDQKSGLTNSGHFIPNPQTNGYRGLRASQMDALNFGDVSTDYRPLTTVAGYYTNAGLSTEICGDKPRSQYLGTGFIDYDVCGGAPGNFANYTRADWPVAEPRYYCFVRAANANGAQTDTMDLYDGAGNYWGYFSVPGTGGWQNYAWVPLLCTDGSGRMAVVPTIYYPNPQTFQVVMPREGGSLRMNCFIFMAASNTPSWPDIYDFQPDGTTQFQATNKLTFTIQGGIVAQSNVLIQLYVTNLLRQVQTLTYQGAAGGVVSFSGTNLWNVSLPITTNRMYGAFVQATNYYYGYGGMAYAHFDTMAPALTWEAEDWDFNGGLYPTNWHPAFCAGFTNGAAYCSVSNVDFCRVSTNGWMNYRYGVATESCSDLPRLAFTNANGLRVADWDLGNVTNGDWENFTRDWPTNMQGEVNVGYNIMVRVASQNSAITDAGSISLVTGGWGTTNQTLQRLGTYGAVNTGGWQVYTWMPVVDADGNLVNFKGGGVATLRNTVDHSGANLTYFMLIPAELPAQPQLSATVSGSQVTLNILTSQTGSSYQMQYKNTLDDATWNSVGDNLAGTGSKLSVTDTISAARFYRVLVTTP